MAHPEHLHPESRQPDILTRLEQAVAAIHDSESFRRYLATQARFHRYSFGNTLLIALQRPDATQVAGFQTWRRLGRFVRKGEKGIAIVVPHTRTVETEDEGEEERLTHFGTGFVFDISQTDGEPLPTVEVPVLTGEQGSDLYSRLAGLAETEGLALECRPPERMIGDVMGFYAPEERRIVVRKAAPLQMAKTLAHELGHHFTGLTDGTRQEHETIAESVAYVICAYHGLDTGQRSFPYVATWSHDTTTFKQVLGTIQRVSAHMIDRLGATPAEAQVAVSIAPERPAEQELAVSPRELVKAFLRPYVLRGETVADLMRSMMGQYGPEHCLQIGGYAYGFEDEQGYPTVRLRPNEIAVTRIGDQRCLYRFSLADLHAEILQEQRQPRLF